MNIKRLLLLFYFFTISGCTMPDAFFAIRLKIIKGDSNTSKFREAFSKAQLKMDQREAGSLFKLKQLDALLPILSSHCNLGGFGDDSRYSPHSKPLFIICNQDDSLIVITQYHDFGELKGALRMTDSRNTERYKIHLSLVEKLRKDFEMKNYRFGKPEALKPEWEDNKINWNVETFPLDLDKVNHG